MRCECGNKANKKCIETEEYFCDNCALLMNINNMGEELEDYHFEELL